MEMLDLWQNYIYFVDLANKIIARVDISPAQRRKTTLQMEISSTHFVTLSSISLNCSVQKDDYLQNRRYSLI